MTWRSGTATIAALSLALLPLGITPANADDTVLSTPAPSAAESSEPAPSAATGSAPVEAVAARTIIVTFDKAQHDPAEAAQAAVAKVADQVADVQVSRVDPITDSMVAVTLDAPLSPAEASRIEDRVGDVAGLAAAQTAGWFRATSTDDVYYNRLWNLNSSGAFGVHAEDAWPVSTGANTVVGVVDTGITAHPDLTGSAARIIGGNVIEGYDFISDPDVAGDGNGRDSNPSDTGDFDGVEYSSWHGTHVAGTIAAMANNGVGVAGVAPDAKIQPLRALGRGGGPETDVIAAMLWGAGIDVDGLPVNSQPADVLNLSLGQGETPCSAPMQTAIDQITARGVVVVVAAGNAGSPMSSSSPANCNNVISVGATGYDGTLADYSNFGNTSRPLTISAPGDSVLSTTNTGVTTPSVAGYAYMSGTSMAAPHVSAIAALLKSIDPTLTTLQAASTLRGTAIAGCAKPACGAGIAQAARAVQTLNANIQTARTLSAQAATTFALKGTTRVGSTLSASAASTLVAAHYSYQWYRDGDPIVGATGPALALAPADLGKSFRSTTTGSLAGYVWSAESQPTPKVAVGILKKTTSPKVKGKSFRVGRTVSASKGSWSPSPSSYSYRWLRSGKSISGATKSTYKLTSKDRGKRISVRVTVRKAGYATTSATSSRHTVKR